VVSLTVGASNVITIALLVGVSLVLGVGMISYYNVFSTQYKERVNLINTLNYESLNQLVRLVAYDVKNGYVWLLLIRLDSSLKPYLIILDDGTSYVSCDAMFVYKPESDNNDLACDNSASNECVRAALFKGQPIYSLKTINTLYESGVTDYYSLAKGMGYPTSGPAYICVISPPTTSKNTLVRVGPLNPEVRLVRVHLITLVNEVPYVVRTYEYSLTYGGVEG